MMSIQQVAASIVRLNDALVSIGVRGPIEIWLGNRADGLILCSILTAHLKFMNQEIMSDDIGDWCMICGIKIRWPRE